ncbi:hypothetical protein MUP59_09835 [Candidatus Bathyarchaeota archaeon]|nr:hypothetical protein [Candidatus Bathyarchaeota archaeon]
MSFNLKNTGLMSSTYMVALETEGQISQQNFSVPIGESATSEAVFDLAKGAHRLAYTVLSSHGVLLSHGNTTIYVETPVLNVLTAMEDASVNMGQSLNASFTVTNPSAMDVEAVVTITVPGIYDETLSFWIPSGKHDISIVIPIPDDMDSRTIRSYFTVNGEREEFWIRINGCSIAVNATLDKHLYREGENATLSLTVKNTGNFTGSFYSRVKLDTFDETKYYNLSVGEQKVIAFRIPVVFTGEKILYTVYEISGRSLYIHSLPIHQMPDEIYGMTLYTDEQEFTIGESVVVHVNATKGGTLRVKAFGSSENFTIDSPRAFTLNIPVPELESGVYEILFEFNNMTVSYLIDVDGYYVRITEFRVDKSVYRTGEFVTLVMTAETNRDFNGTLKLQIYDPLEDQIIEFEVENNFTAGENTLTASKPLQTNVSGVHSMVYGIYTDLTGNSPVNLASGLKYFEVADTFPPITTIGLSGQQGNHEWFFSGVAVTLQATDDVSVDKTEYSFDNVTWITFSEAFNVNSEGGSTIAYRSVDINRNNETAKVKVVKIDRTSPVVIITPITVWRSPTVTVTWNGSDSSSGVDYYTIRLDDGSWINKSVETTYDFTSVGDGNHKVFLKAFDIAGNSKEYSITFIVNTSLIGGPGWVDDAEVFGGLAAALLIAITLILKKKSVKMLARAS